MCSATGVPGAISSRSISSGVGIRDAGFVAKFVIGLIAGSAAGLVLGVTISLVAGLVAGLGAFASGAARLTVGVPVFVVRNLRFGSTPDESAVVGFALAFGFTLVARFDFDRYDHASLYKPGLGTWLVVAAGLGLAVASVSAARAVPRDPADAASPRAVLAHDRSAALVLGLAVLLAAGVVVGIEAINRARDRDRVLGQNSGTGP